ncbi:hypothetical protein [Butyrivibrio sp. MC2021]|uniref:hypothetical protein n=1 Tax=Butyrivibrio sp. MC2021 TaxID=1408306 RepID=UPI0018CC5D05|nr:hypothetical protein [Butyrivibrio sp. MC2021]
MAYFVIRRFLYEVALFVFGRCVGDLLGCGFEKLSVPQVVCVILIVIGIAGLKILGKE